MTKPYPPKSEQKLTTTIFVLIFLLMALGAFLAIVKNNRESREIDLETKSAQTKTMATTTTPLGKQVVVIYTTHGFRPATTTISKGDTIVITNKSNESVWPVSNGYPIISNLFDAKKPVVTGQSYLFTFTDAGTFMFSNHLKPAQVGEIIVK